MLGKFRCTVGTKTPVEEITFTASAEAKICLNCPLPAKKCRPRICKRYKEEMQKLKESKNESAICRL